MFTVRKIGMRTILLRYWWWLQWLSLLYLLLLLASLR